MFAFESFLQGFSGFLFFLGLLDVGGVGILEIVYCFCGLCVFGGTDLY